MARTTIGVGSRVQYSAAFLRSAGIYTGDLPFAKGEVTAIEKLGPGLAVIDWDTPDMMPKRVLVTNLKIVEEYEPN